ncbi:unnamed protein product [Cylicostephanus goldi]|uniref:Uncharacterized protein n=1 Tax=Cylicostephanus goldi TaxID=71465 RepID=A0A3P7QTE2_CYLGO|nr:unnamed protein product [Cylicostephanus goldi]
MHKKGAAIILLFSMRLISARKLAIEPHFQEFGNLSRQLVDLASQHDAFTSLTHECEVTIAIEERERRTRGSKIGWGVDDTNYGNGGLGVEEIQQ